MEKLSVNKVAKVRCVIGLRAEGLGSAAYFAHELGPLPGEHMLSLSIPLKPDYQFQIANPARRLGVIESPMATSSSETSFLLASREPRSGRLTCTSADALDFTGMSGRREVKRAKKMVKPFLSQGCQAMYVELEEDLCLVLLSKPSSELFTLLDHSLRKKSRVFGFVFKPSTRDLSVLDGWPKIQRFDNRFANSFELDYRMANRLQEGQVLREKPKTLSRIYDPWFREEDKDSEGRNAIGNSWDFAIPLYYPSAGRLEQENYRYARRLFPYLKPGEWYPYVSGLEGQLVNDILEMLPSEEETLNDPSKISPACSSRRRRINHKERVAGHFQGTYNGTRHPLDCAPPFYLYKIGVNGKTIWVFECVIHLRALRGFLSIDDAMKFCRGGSGRLEVDQEGHRVFRIEHKPDGSWREELKNELDSFFGIHSKGEIC